MIIVETGDGIENANSYVSLAEADAFHATNLHSVEWGAILEATRQRALITATRILDQHWAWHGWKSNVGQALQWPRTRVRDVDLGPSIHWYESNVIPVAIKRATILLAFLVTSQNRETETGGEGINSFTLEGVMSVSFNMETKAEILPDWLMTELLKLGDPMWGRTKFAKLQRT